MKSERRVEYLSMERNAAGELKAFDEKQCQAEVYYWPWANGGAGHVAIHVFPPGHQGTYLTSTFDQQPNNARALLRSTQDTSQEGLRVVKNEYANKPLKDFIEEDNRKLGIPAGDLDKGVIKIPLPVVNRVYFSDDEKENSFVKHIQKHGEYSLFKNNCADLTRRALQWAGYTDPNKKDSSRLPSLPSAVASESCVIALEGIRQEKQDILKRKYKDDVEKIKALLHQDKEALGVKEIQEKISWKNVIRKSSIPEQKGVISKLISEKNLDEFYKKLMIAIKSNSDLHYLEAIIPEDRRHYAVILGKIDELNAEAKKIEERGFSKDAQQVRDLALVLSGTAKAHFLMSPAEQKDNLASFKKFCADKINGAQEVTSRYKGVQMILSMLSRFVSSIGVSLVQAAKSTSIYKTHAAYAHAPAESPVEQDKSKRELK